MIPSWSNSSFPVVLHPLPIGEVRVHTPQEGIVPVRGFSHNNSAPFSLGQVFFRASDIAHFGRFLGGTLLSNVYLNIRISEQCAGISSS